MERREGKRQRRKREKRKEGRELRKLKFTNKVLSSGYMLISFKDINPAAWVLFLF
jgi:hypothetical protein